MKMLEQTSIRMVQIACIAFGVFPGRKDNKEIETVAQKLVKLSAFTQPNLLH